MTTEEKNTITGFLDLAADYLRDGHRREREKPSVEPGVSSGNFSSLPLAYQVNEDEAGEHSDFLNSNDSLETVAMDITACKACALATTRTNTVPGEGANNPLVMIIGEGPGADEDRAGRPFVGKAGQLLDRMLESIGLSRNKNCFIANMVKCRPPGNRDPAAEETSACFPYLKRQITLLRPGIILCVGRIASQNLLGTSTGINALRGAFTEFKVGGAAELTDDDTVIPVLCTFHPSALLRDESLKRPAWEDLKLLKSRLDSMGVDQ